MWSHLPLNRKSAKYFNIWFQTQKLQENNWINHFMCHSPVFFFFFFSCCVRPLRQRRVFPPESLSKNIRRCPARRELSGKVFTNCWNTAGGNKLHQLCLWVHPAAGKHTQSLNIAHATPEYKRRNVKGYIVLWCTYDLSLGWHGHSHSTMTWQGSVYINQQLQAERAGLNVFTYLLLLSARPLYFIKMYYIDSNRTVDSMYCYHTNTA